LKITACFYRLLQYAFCKSPSELVCESGISKKVSLQRMFRSLFKEKNTPFFDSDREIRYFYLRIAVTL